MKRQKLELGLKILVKLVIWNIYLKKMYLYVQKDVN